MNWRENIEHSTSNIELRRQTALAITSMLGVRCSMFDVVLSFYFGPAMLWSRHNLEIAHRDTESEGICAGAIASWTAAVLCRFRSRHRKKSARGLAHSKTSRQFGRFMDRNMSLK